MDILQKFGIKGEFVYDFNRMIEVLKSFNGKPIAVDIETNGLTFYNSNLISIGFATSKKEGYVFSCRSLTDEQIKQLIKTYNSNVSKSYLYNMYFDSCFTKGRYGVWLKGSDDGLILAHTMLIDRKIDNRGLSLKDLARDYTEYGDYEKDLNEYKSVISKEKGIKKKDVTYDLFPDDILLPYNLIDCCVTFEITEKLLKYKDKLISEGWNKLEEVLKLKYNMNREYMFAYIEGVNIDKDKIYQIGNDFLAKRKEVYESLINSQEINKAEKIIKRKAVEKKKNSLKTPINLKQVKRVLKDNKFNLGSSAHKKILFYEILNIPQVLFTDKKELATGAEVVSKFSKDYPILAKFEEYGMYTKGLTAFLGMEENEEGESGVLKILSKEGKVYPSVNITGTITGRTTTNSPNLAQIPSKSDLKVIKDIFIPPKDYYFCGFDLSNFEVRGVTMFSQEPNFIKAFDDGLDMHSMTALNTFKDKMDIDFTLPLKEQLKQIKEKYSDTYRFYSKAILFGTVYGIQSKGLSKNLNVSEEYAQEMIDLFFKNNSKIKEYIDKVRELAKENAYVENKDGLRLMLPAIKRKERGYVIEAELKKAVNFTIQSYNATFMYRNIVNFFNEVREKKLDIKMFTTIYDALYCFVHKDIDKELVKTLFKKHFEMRVDNVDILIDCCYAEVNESWYNTKDY